ncbi:MAG: MopE-related protein [Myxococcota bacterium]|nr:MopE-related protein [Myxococcota bacterium]
MTKHILAGLSLLLTLGCNDKSTPVDTDDTIITGIDGDDDGYTTEDGDCDDGDADISPDSLELCDGIDNNCDGQIDEGVTTPFYEDADGDGFGDDDSSIEVCEAPEGYSAVGGDCDDDQPEAYPGNIEYCDGIDNNCDGQIDEEVSSTWYADTDGDGYGDEKSTIEACEQPEGYTDLIGDCDDTDAGINPGAKEFCDDPNDYNCDGSVGYADVDGDGFAACEECNDKDAAINPDGEEVCDGTDNDCDGDTDEDDATDAATWYADTDTDGYGDADITDVACDQPSGYVSDDTDCDDTDTTVNPDGEEVCDGSDNDCDGAVDEDDASDVLTWYADTDGDGYGDASVSTGSCSQPSGYVANSDDCDDTDTAISPNGVEVCDGADNDCDGTVDEDDATDAATWYADNDTDGYGDAGITDVACDQPSGYVADNTDCDDGNNTQYPGADEYCNGEDDDCDGDTDEVGALDETAWYADADTDGYGDATNAALACDQPSGYVADDTDCDDTDAAQYPGADEYCNAEDDDCDGTVDEDDALDAATWYGDGDGDGYGNSVFSLVQCDQPSGYVSDGTDCDDSDAAQYPGADEYCNAEDDNCDGTIDEDDALDVVTWYADTDGDTYGDAAATDIDCSQPSGYVADDTDCDDSTAAVNPAATEICDSIDNDCDTLIDDDDDSLDTSTGSTFYTDSDGDGYGDAASYADTCAQPSGTVADATDCDDSDAAQYPGADEYCNAEDDDCDGDTDEEAVDGDWYATDDDSDGFGAIGSTDWACEGADNEYDCNDTDSSEPVVVNGGTGSASGDGSAASPLDAIQDGIDTANECVIVYQGTYFEALDFNGQSIDVTGVDGSESTIIDASGYGAPVVSFATGELATLTGFTLTNGEGYHEASSSSYACTSITTCTDYIDTYAGGGVYINGADPELIDVLIEDNLLPESSTTTSGNDTFYVYSYGGGVFVEDGTLLLEDSSISANSADQGGGVYLDATSVGTVDTTWVTANTATDGGGFEVDGGELSLTNVASLWNEATSDGGGIFLIDAVLYATNVSQGGDDALNGGGVYVSGSSAATMLNSIIVEAGTGEGVLVGGSASFTGTYNDVYNNAGGDYLGTTDPTGSNGNISTDPVFTSWSDNGDSTDDDMTLSAKSPAIDAGDPSVSYDDADGTTNDMGAWGGPAGSW